MSANLASQLVASYRETIRTTVDLVETCAAVSRCSQSLNKIEPVTRPYSGVVSSPLSILCEGPLCGTCQSSRGYVLSMETFSFLPKSSLNASVLSHIPNLGPYLHLNQSNIHFSKRSQLYQQLVPARETIMTLLDSVSFSQLIIFILCTAWAVGPVIRKRPAVTNAVYHGYRSWLEPTFLVQARYIVFARDIISSGYRKVCAL